MEAKMNIKLLIFACLFTATLINADYYGSPPVGWYWGNAPVPQKSSKNTKEPKTPSETLSIIQAAFNNVKAEAVLSPTPENVYKYLVFQHWIQNQSTVFSNVALDVVSNNPELNYSIENPTTSSVRQTQLATELSLKTSFAKNLAKNAGLFYFYRGANAMDVVEAKTISHFAQTYGFNLLGISMDGAKADGLDTKPDTGQAQALGVKAYPALFIVLPQRSQATLITYGYLAEDDLLSTLYKKINGEAK